jgi:hypothetical protein
MAAIVLTFAACIVWLVPKPRDGTFMMGGEGH